MSELILVGDRVLIAPDAGERQTDSGLYLPASIAEQERVQLGRVVRVGPGYVLPNPEYSESEPWVTNRDAVRYLPLQAAPGDVAFFLRKEAIEIEYNAEKYLIIPHSAILALERSKAGEVLDDLFDN
jgi:co-chaperonin GroES (HSP10)